MLQITSKAGSTCCCTTPPIPADSVLGKPQIFFHVTDQPVARPCTTLCTFLPCTASPYCVNGTEGRMIEWRHSQRQALEDPPDSCYSHNFVLTESVGQTSKGPDHYMEWMVKHGCGTRLLICLAIDHVRAQQQDLSKGERRGTERAQDRHRVKQGQKNPLPHPPPHTSPHSQPSPHTHCSEPPDKPIQRLSPAWPQSTQVGQHWWPSHSPAAQRSPGNKGGQNTPQMARVGASGH